MARWISHGWNEIGSSGGVSFLRNKGDVIAVDKRVGAPAWRDRHLCAWPATAVQIVSRVYVGCAVGGARVFVLSARTGSPIGTKPLRMQGINKIQTAGADAIAVTGWNDGAAMTFSLVFLSTPSLRQIGQQKSEAAYLGVLGERAYIDDYCCNGRGDAYRPATIYTLSLKDGSESTPVDLYPDKDEQEKLTHPVGQGGQNYMQGRFLFVVVGNRKYRYDVTDLREPYVEVDAR